jgi:hypothetical protein
LASRFVHLGCVLLLLLVHYHDACDKDKGVGSRVHVLRTDGSWTDGGAWWPGPAHAIITAPGPGWSGKGNGG